MGFDEPGKNGAGEPDKTILRELVEDYKEHARLALYHQREAYFRMVGILEALTGGDDDEVKRIRAVVQNLMF